MKFTLDSLCIVARFAGETKTHEKSRKRESDGVLRKFRKRFLRSKCVEERSKCSTFDYFFFKFDSLWAFVYFFTRSQSIAITKKNPMFMDHYNIFPSPIHKTKMFPTSLSHRQDIFFLRNFCFFTSHDPNSEGFFQLVHPRSFVYKWQKV